jgi:hypothetical protein
MPQLPWQSVTLYFVFNGMVHTTNSDYFLEQRYPVHFCNGEVWCSLWGTDWIVKYYLDKRRVLRVNSSVLSDFQHKAHKDGKDNCML